MLHKTRGIVFRFTKYGETSIIVNVFTELFGLQAYIVNGIRTKSSKSKIALFQPLTLLDMVVYYREHANINRIKEIKCFHPYQTLYQDVRKSAVAMFINEIMNKTVKEESHAQELSDFMVQSLIALDSNSTGIENYHLIFMLKLSRFLGFGAHNVNEVVGGRSADIETEMIVDQLLSCEYSAIIPMSNVLRRKVLDLLLSFYADHVENLGEVKSVQVLRDVLG
ncbi:MAG TPA: DNA repair protein RecO [Chryseolinea sp.]|nr:DNA repair protein RecO [Chryseolinea sp.]HPM29230.1 DNA repair protein RecO [Chryseolinea sp.]